MFLLIVTGLAHQVTQEDVYVRILAFLVFPARSTGGGRCSTRVVLVEIRLFGHFLPRTAGSAEPDEGFKDAPVADRRSPAFGTDLMYGKQMFDPLPIGVVHFPRDFFGSFRFPVRHGDLLSWSPF